MIAERLERELGRAGEAGVRELLPDRLGFHQLGEVARHSGRAGPRFGGGLDGGVS